MAFHFDPPLELDLEVPVRIKLSIPLRKFEDLYTRQHPLNALKPTALVIAKLVSNEIFGSTEAIREDFRPICHWNKDGTLEAIFFYLNHRLRFEDVGFNPEYISVFAGENEHGELVLRPRVVNGMRRKESNDEAEGRRSPQLELASL
ncbi:hypothetical protein NEMBOFW57_009294 [Staphylotrichum longicolle]|uniref:Uncharacterized protein n=1 Tax=Staphylotrichum longicolle TaxID=669026 RepID=A0AAD4HVU5_9PEZI|nr:hypothetical protein NEMBOFW57_009294 [Staphylotrichum longicolle]